MPEQLVVGEGFVEPLGFHDRHADLFVEVAHWNKEPDELSD